MPEEIDFSKYRVKIPKRPKPNGSSRHYKRMLRRLRKELPRLNG